MSETGACYKCGSIQPVTAMKCSACGAIAPVKTAKAAESSPTGCIALVLIALAVGAVFGTRACANEQSDSEGGGGNAPALESGAEEIPVRGDPAGAKYYVLSAERMANGNYEVMTRRDGTSGTSYARREIDCTGDRSFRYLGEGDTREEAESDTPDTGPMAELVTGSISAEITEHVCLSIRP